MPVTVRVSPSGSLSLPRTPRGRVAAMAVLVPRTVLKSFWSAGRVEPTPIVWVVATGVLDMTRDLADGRRGRPTQRSNCTRLSRQRKTSLRNSKSAGSPRNDQDDRSMAERFIALYSRGHGQ